MCHFNKSVSFFLLTMPLMGLISLSSAIAGNFEEEIVVAQNSKPTTSSSLTNQSRGEWNGFKGYRHHRSGYKKHTDGWWYPEAAFQPGVHVDSSNTIQKKTTQKQKKEEDKPWFMKMHIDYCAAKYKSYTSSDNTYQPYEGGRKQCLSRYYKGKGTASE